MQKNDVLAYFGSITATAKALGITHAAVSKWGETIPKLRAYEIDELTGGQLKADQSKPNPAE